MKKLIIIILFTALYAELSGNPGQFGNSEQFGNHGNVKYKIGMNTFTMCTYRTGVPWINGHTPYHTLGVAGIYWGSKALGMSREKALATSGILATFHEVFFDGFGNKPPYPSSMGSDPDGFDLTDFVINVWVAGLNYLIDWIIN